MENYNNIENNNDIVSKISDDVKICKLRKKNDGTQKNMQCMEELHKVEKANAQKKNEELAEKYDIEKMMVNAIEAYLLSLDNDLKKATVLM